MPAGVGLPPIEASAIEEQGRSEPVAIQVHHRRGYQRAHPPIPPEHPVDLRALGKLGDGNLDDAIEHGVARAIRFGDLPQGGGEHRPLLEALHHRIGQRQSHLWLGPGGGPVSCLIWSAKGNIAAASLQINA